LRTGEVAVEGCDTTYLVTRPGETFFRLFNHQEFDVAEMSLSTYMLARSKGDWPYRAIPVFLSRAFPHSSIYVRAGAGIAQPAELRGRVVGAPSYHLTRGLCVRGMLQDEYGVRPDDMAWRIGGVDAPEDFDYVGVDLSGLDIKPIAKGAYLAGLLLDGEIDAIVSYRDPQILYDGNPGISRLFGDFREAERRYYEKTGIFPVMHVVGIRETLVEKYPWLARSVFKAFDAAKLRCTERLNDLDAPIVTLPWVAAETQATMALMGADFWPYGVEPNRTTLEAQTRWSHEQGLSPTRFAVEELFVPSTLSWYRD